MDEGVGLLADHFFRRESQHSACRGIHKSDLPNRTHSVNTFICGIENEARAFLGVLDLFEQFLRVEVAL